MGTAGIAWAGLITCCAGPRSTKKKRSGKNKADLKGSPSPRDFSSLFRWRLLKLSLRGRAHRMKIIGTLGRAVAASFALMQSAEARGGGHSGGGHFSGGFSGGGRYSAAA